MRSSLDNCIEQRQEEGHRPGRESRGEQRTGGEELTLQESTLDAPWHLLLAYLLERKGENDQAIVGFERAVAINPTNREAL